MTGSQFFLIVVTECVTPVTSMDEVRFPGLLLKSAASTWSVRGRYQSAEQPARPSDAELMSANGQFNEPKGAEGAGAGVLSSACVALLRLLLLESLVGRRGGQQPFLQGFDRPFIENNSLDVN